MPDGRTVARPITETQTGPKSRGAGKQSPQRVLQERLTLGKYKPRAWAVAMVLDAYSRQDAEGRRFATVYHGILAEKTGLSIQNVRRALTELVKSEAPLYERRGISGQRRKLRARNGWELDTRGVAYYWIENLEAYLAARDTARAANVLAFDERKGEHHAERVKLQAAMLTGQMDRASYEAQIAQLDAKARGRLPKHATAKKATARCLTAKQMAWFAGLLLQGGAVSHSTLLASTGGDEKRVREFHALHGHIFGNGDAGAGCTTCEETAFKAVAQHKAIIGALVSNRAEAVRCGCGARVVRNNSAGAVLFWGWATGAELEPHNDCIHEQNRLLKLRSGAHQ